MYNKHHKSNGEHERTTAKMAKSPRQHKQGKRATKQRLIKLNPKLKTDYSKPGVLTVKYYINPDALSANDKQLRHDIDKTLAIASEFYDYMLDFMKTHETTNATLIHKETYSCLSGKATEYDFPTAYIQAIRDDAIRAMKSWNTNHPDKKWQLDSHRSSDASMSLDRRTFSFNSGRMECTVSKIGKRFRVALDPRDAAWFFELHKDLDFDLRAKSGRLGKRKKGGVWQYYIAICYKYQPRVVLFDPDVNRVVGVDRGLVEPFVTSDGDVASGVKHDHAVARRYDYNVSTMRAKGTRSAKRKLRESSGRRARFSLDCARRYAHELVDSLSPGDVLVFEDLSGINVRTIGKFEHSAKYNSLHSYWNHGELLDAVVSLALQKSVYVLTVNAAFSSQECPWCGCINPANRWLGLFECVDCHHHGYADACAGTVVRGRGVKGIIECLPAEYWKQGDVKLPNEMLLIPVSISSHSVA